MTAQENLAWVIEAAWGNPTWDGSTLRPIDRTIADAVVAFLTSDEAVDRAAQAIWESGDAGESKIPWSEADTPEWPTARAEFRADARAAILAACGVESLPLDPEPWAMWGDPVFGTAPSGIFAPRPGYEQRREFYEKGAE